VEGDKAGDAISHSIAPLLGPGGVALSDSEKAEALADCHEAQFLPVDNPSDPAFTELVDVEMRAYEYAPTSEPTFTTPSEVIMAIKGLKFGKAPGPNGVPNSVLRHLPKRAITFLTKVINTVLRRQYFRLDSAHARELPILKPGKDPTQPSSYRLICLLDTVSKFFENILLTMVLREIKVRGRLRDEQSNSDPSRARRCSWPTLLKDSRENLTRIF
jgi:hypothetical protein